MNKRTPSLVLVLAAAMLLAPLGAGTAAATPNQCSGNSGTPAYVPGAQVVRQTDHENRRVQLGTGTIGGKKAVWANLTDAGGQPNLPAAGDRVWYDRSDGPRTRWTQCGPFGVTEVDKPTRTSYDTRPGWYRACLDVPGPTPFGPRHACTAWAQL